ncbi:DUF4132 domain-containing protein [Sinorhizobium sp. RAC02]|uniref:WGR and DUF4132 domain-containing protein n=1 Tax=Sinorhizobium sp. RAC02 TaxID=1842534 RepID=UPI00083CF3B7|nr:DUF4132 domain-containing protein [Sinorhizobium sp. RAC02]AOF92311.1 WGR domain protein [Sinorhizobium sp. RAC02]
MERYELIEGTSSKFWEASVDGTTLTVTYGRIGTQGQTKEKQFDSADAATKEKNRLVKEKTGKGYVPAGAPSATPEPATKKEETRQPVQQAAAPTPAEPLAATLEKDTVAPTLTAAPDSEPAQGPVAIEPSNELGKLLGKPLATRTYPDGVLYEAAAAWQALAGTLQMLLPKAVEEGKEAVDWLQERLGSEGPKMPGGGAVGWLKSKLAGKSDPSIDMEEARNWIVKIEAATQRLTVSMDGSDEDRRTASLLCLSYFFHWLAQTAGAAALAQAALPLLGTANRPRYGYEHSAWSSPLALALRNVLVKVSDEEYQQAVDVFSLACDDQVDHKRRAYFAFVLGDDRTGEHDLKPLAVLNAAASAGEDVGAILEMVPLIAEAPPSAVARWRTKRTYFMYFTYFDVSLQDIAATVVASARHHGETSLPTLEWLLHYANDDQRRAMARIMLATGDNSALGLLIPFLHEKWIRAALDEATEESPDNMFQQFVSAQAAGRNEPVIRARVMDMTKRYPEETLRRWLHGNAKALANLDRLLETQNVPIAASDAVPPVLTDPPWRKKAKKTEDVVLALKPLATPFRYEPDEPPGEENRWRISQAKVVTDVDELVALIAEFEATPLPDWYGVPARSRPLPQRGDEQENVLGFVYERVMQIYRARSYAISSSGWNKLFAGIDRQPDSLALVLWSCPGVATGYFTDDVYPRMMARFGERGLPGLLKQIEGDPTGMLDRARDVDAGEIAPHAARALLKLKKARLPAMQWLRRHRETAVTRLVPEATGAMGPARDAAEHALRWLAKDREDGRAMIEAVARSYASQDPKAPDAVAEVLDRDPLQRYPARIAKVPGWFKPASLTRPVLKQGGALSDEAMVAIAEMLSFSTPESIYAGIDIVKEATTAESLAALAWDVFAAWLAEGAPSKDGWALRGLGWLGDDECARKLTRLIRKWPGEAAHARAVTGLDVLADIGTDVALMNLNGIAEKLKFKGLQEKAREKIAQLAEARELTPEELADRLAPDLDLDDRGGMDLVFGERRFRVGFDEFLKPWAKDETGKRLKDLPKPNKSDDQELAGEATKRWSALKKDARAVASIQISRLENMLSHSRRVTPQVFWVFFASHPLIRHLTQRLVWGVYADLDPRTAPSTIFRVSDDLSVTDAQDDTLDLDFSAEASGVIGLIHPLHLPAGGLDAWGALFGDYEISQPFPQLGREIYELTEAEKNTNEIGRFDGLKVETPRLRGMASRGWALGSPQDGGCIWWLERPVRFLDGSTKDAMFYFGEGIFTGGGDWEDKQQTLGKLTFEPPYGRNQSEGPKFGQLDPVTASEMLRGLALLAETAVK